MPLLRGGWLLVLLALAFTACGEDPEPARPTTLAAGFRVESGERFAYEMEVPVEWQSMRGGAVEGARVRLAGSEFVADITVSREETRDRSIEAIRDTLNAYLAQTGQRASREGAVVAGGLSGWTWEFPAQPAQGPQPRRDARQVVIFYDPTGAQWLITFSWASPEAEREHRPAFERAVRTFRPKQ